MSLVFDIETEGLSREEILATVPPFDRENVKLGVRKKPETILQYLETAEEDYYERFVERAALDARTAKVLALGIRVFRAGGHDDHIYLGGDESEREAIISFWDWWQSDYHLGQIIGFNILKFDLPFLVRRSWCLGIGVPSDVYDGRYFHRSFVDLMARWALGNREDMISLDGLARFLGLPGKEGSGAKFASLFYEDRAKAVNYLVNDLSLTENIARKMGLL